jgi:FkbM family methyltransferase
MLKSPAQAIGAPGPIAISSVVTVGALEEYNLMRYSFELFHREPVMWYIRCDPQSEQALSRLPNTFCTASISDEDEKLAPEDRGFNTIVGQKMAAMGDAWADGKSNSVLFLDADLLFTAPLLPLLRQTAATVVLTPHHFAPERSALEESKYGKYNSGFVFSRTPEFHVWWLEAYISQPENFTDQQCLDDAGRDFSVECLPLSANVGSWRGPCGTVGIPEFEIPNDCLFLHCHFLQPGEGPERLIQKRFAVEYFEFANLMNGIAGDGKNIFTPRQIVQKAFALQCLAYLRTSPRPGHSLLLRRILEEDKLGIYQKSLTAGAVPETPNCGTNEPLPDGDYVSAGLRTVRPDCHFPQMALADKSKVTWEHYRRWVPHNYWSDKRYPECGFLNRDEAHILYNSALQFRGRRALEIGCWMGWSACHLALAGVNLDVVDPLLADPVFQQSALESLRSAGVLRNVQLFAGRSPGLVEELAAKWGRRWSLIFIDGSHAAPDPLNDARAALAFAEADALVLFHDLASPEVSPGLDVFRDAGWSTMVYQTTQVMGAAWRGDACPIRHIPDPAVPWTLPAHLEGYKVSGAEDAPHAPEVDWSGRYYTVGGLPLEIPRDHMLPQFQEQHPLYDRFLPFIGSAAPEGSWIVDVGANVGDTVAALVPETKASILAIEGHDTFYRYFLRNMGQLDVPARSRVRCVRALVGSGSVQGDLQAESGTAKLIQNSSSTSSTSCRTLDEITQSQGIRPDQVFLLKTDTDGFDADVLVSAKQILRSGNPILYFENQVDTREQAQRFKQLYRFLADYGYESYWVLDNFGNPLLESIESRALDMLTDYLLTQQERRSTRTFYYCDVLAAKPDRQEEITRAIERYKLFIDPSRQVTTENTVVLESR